MKMPAMSKHPRMDDLRGASLAAMSEALGETDLRRVLLVEPLSPAEMWSRARDVLADFVVSSRTWRYDVCHMTCFWAPQH